MKEFILEEVNNVYSFNASIFSTVLFFLSKYSIISNQLFLVRVRMYRNSHLKHSKIFKRFEEHTQYDFRVLCYFNAKEK